LNFMGWLSHHVKGKWHKGRRIPLKIALERPMFLAHRLSYVFPQCIICSFEHQSGCLALRGYDILSAHMQTYTCLNTRLTSRLVRSLEYTRPQEVRGLIPQSVVWPPPRGVYVGRSTLLTSNSSPSPTLFSKYM